LLRHLNLISFIHVFLKSNCCLGLSAYWDVVIYLFLFPLGLTMTLNQPIHFTLNIEHLRVLIRLKIISVIQIPSRHLHIIRHIYFRKCTWSYLLLLNPCHCRCIFWGAKRLFKVSKCLCIESLHRFEGFNGVLLIIIMNTTSLVDFLKAIFKVFVLEHCCVLWVHVYLWFFAENAFVVLSTIGHVKIMWFSSLPAFILLMLP